jgi:hypothetical protein
VRSMHSSGLRCKLFLYDQREIVRPVDTLRRYKNQSPKAHFSVGVRRCEQGLSQLNMVDRSSQQWAFSGRPDPRQSANLTLGSLPACPPLSADVAKTSKGNCFSPCGVRRWKRHLTVQSRKHPVAVSLYANVREVKRSAETSVWIGYPGVLRSKLRSGSFSVQLASHDCAVPIESKLEILSLILVPVKLAGLNQVGSGLKYSLSHVFLSWR